MRRTCVLSSFAAANALAAPAYGQTLDYVGVLGTERQQFANATGAVTVGTAAAGPPFLPSDLSRRLEAIVPSFGQVATADPAMFPSAALSGSPAPQLAMASVAQDLGTPAALPRELELQLPVLVDGSYRGDIDVLIGQDNRINVRIAPLIAALGPLLRPDVIARLQALPVDNGLVDAQLLLPDIGLRLDETTIEVVAIVAPDARPQTGLSLAGEDRFTNVTYEQPENFAAAATLDFGGVYSFKQPTGFQNESGRMTGWVNVGGSDGFFVEAELFYDSAGLRRFRRGDIRISKDDVTNAVRFSAGDVLYRGQGFQTAPRIGGISVQRLYEDIDPLRIIRPVGRTSFTLDRSATVDVIVNGAPYRTIRFDPGTYNINDIPFAEGGNNVELLIRDDSGVESRLQFSGYSSANLLAGGLNEFGIVGGVLSSFGAGGVNYQGDEPAVSGFYRQGINNNLTIGVNGQAGRGVAQIGAEAIVGTSALLLSARGAFSRIANLGSGHTWEVNAQYRPLGSQGVSTFFIEGNARYTSADFGGLGNLTPRNAFKLETAVRTGFALGASTNVSAAYTYQFARGGDIADISRLSVTASRRFGNIAAFATFDRREVRGQSTENRFLATVSIPLGGRSAYVRGIYDSQRDAYRVELQKLPRGLVGDLSGNFAVETNNSGEELLGQLRYRDNRFIAAVDNSIIYRDAQSTIATAVSRYNVRTGVGFTDGKVLVSPTLGEGSFVAVAKGRAIKQGKVVLNDTPDGPQAVSDWLGAAAFGGIRGYVPVRITADVVTDEAGFEAASRTLNLLPGARTGYLVMVGQSAEAVVVATVVKPDGSPVALLAGKVTRIDESGPVTETFTNREGRLVVESLVAGTYQLDIAGLGSAQFTITEDQVGIVQIGTVVLTPVSPNGGAK